MDTIFNRTSFPDLYGLRIHHINQDYGDGTIMRAYPVCKDGSDDISIDIRFDNGRPTTSFSLLKCIKKGLLVMDSADYTTEKLENMLRSIRSSEETNATPQSCSFPIDNQIQSDMNDFFFEFDFEYNEKERKRAEKREARKAGPPVETEDQIAEKRRIYNYLVNDRKVRYLVHFTPITNIKSILENGILPRTNLREKGIPADIPDPLRWDSCLDYSSLSVSFPNYRVLYAKCMQTDFHFSILLLDPKLILNKPLEDISYLTDNAAASKNGIIEEKTGFQSAKALFCDQIIINGKEVSRAQLGIPVNYTTNPQAEVFVWGRIDPTYITEVVVKDYSSREQLTEMLGLLPNEKVKPISIIPSYYLPRKDYQYWKPPTFANEDKT